MAHLNSINMITIYNSPPDYPGKFVARWWTTENGRPKIGDIFDVAQDLEPLQAKCQDLGLVKIIRDDSDPASIVETWL